MLVLCPLCKKEVRLGHDGKLAELMRHIRRTLRTLKTPSHDGEELCVALEKREKYRGRIEMPNNVESHRFYFRK